MSTAIVTTARAAAAAIDILLPATESPSSRTSHDGRGCVPTTLSITTLSGHGAAMLVAVSMSMADRITAIQW